MAKFIEVHADGVEMLVNLDHVQLVGSNSKGGTVLFIDNDKNYIDENYEQIRIMIGEAQGGIPLEQGRNY